MIWVIGGTSEGRAISEWLSEQGHSFYLSVATELGSATYQGLTEHFVVGRLDAEAFGTHFQKRGITHVIDASHPHAPEVSKTAMAVCEKMNIRYTRYQRPEIFSETDLIFETFDLAWQYLQTTEGRILVTGSKELKGAVALIKPDRLVARVVPCEEGMKLCAESGIQADRIIGLKGPFTTELNRVLFRVFDIKFIVFKSSGEGSGFTEKVDAARQENVVPLIIKMPVLDYPEVVTGREDMKSFIMQLE